MNKAFAYDVVELECALIHFNNEEVRHFQQIPEVLSTIDRVYKNAK